MKGLWAWILGTAGVLIIAFVAITGGRYGAWLLWLAIPYLLLSFVYAIIVYALPEFMYVVEESQPEQQDPVQDLKE